MIRAIDSLQHQSVIPAPFFVSVDIDKYIIDAHQVKIVLGCNRHAISS
jgi:hypothetical protein